MRLSRLQVPAPARLGDMWRPGEVRSEGLRSRRGVGADVPGHLRGSSGGMNSRHLRRRASDTHDCPLAVEVEAFRSSHSALRLGRRIAGLAIIGNRLANLGIHGHRARRRTASKTGSVRLQYPFSSPTLSALGQESGNQSGIMSKAPAPGNVTLRQTRFGSLLTPHLLTEVESLLAHRDVLISGLRRQGKVELDQPRDRGA